MGAPLPDGPEAGRSNPARELAVEPEGAVCPAVYFQELSALELMVTAEGKLNVILGIMGKTANLKWGFTLKVEKSAACVRKILDIL